MKNSKLTKALVAITTIGAIASIVRLVLMVLDKKSQHTDDVLYCDDCENYDDCNFVMHPDMYDQAEEEDTDNE